MEAAGAHTPSNLPSRARRIEWSAVATWLLGFGLVAYLGLSGGGYDPLVHDRVGVAVWWVLLGGALVGALPHRRLGPLAWGALGLLAAFTLWTALSLTWTESLERTWADLARVGGYLGVFALALFVRGRGGARRMVAAVGAGIALVALVALLSRLHPAWFPDAEQTGRFLTSSRDRLSYPIDYWNALAALIAIGAPLILHTAAEARAVAFRALAAAALPAMALTSFLTLSRGGIAAAAIALAVYLALSPDRLPKLLTLLLAGAGAALLIAAVDSRDALREGLLNPAARDQGDEVLVLTIVVCAAVGLLQAGIAAGLDRGMRPRWTTFSRRQASGAGLACLLALLAVAVVWVGSGAASDAWDEFRQTGRGPGEGTERLGSSAGEGRYQFWRSAIREEETRPLAGTGSGTFEYWWARDGETRGIIRDAHSLYMQTLGELGILGLLLLIAFLLAVLAGGARALLRAGGRGRPQLAAALAGCLAFCFTAVFDWMWQIPVLPVSMLLLASVLVTAGGSSRRTAPPAWLPMRAGLAAAAVAAIVAIAVPLSSTAEVRQSQEDFAAGQLAAALDEARSAESAMPGAATPRLQQALVLEAQGNLGAAAAAAREATEREETNWRTWLVLSRIEAERGRAPAALAAYRRARSLNPRSELFRE